MPDTKNTAARVRSLPGIRRLPMYLTQLRGWLEEGRRVISAEQLAQSCDMVTAVVKKDIELTRATGKTGVGFEIAGLVEAIEAYIGWNKETVAVLVGAGRLGSALLGFAGLRRRRVRFLAAFDHDPQKIGHRDHGVPVRSVVGMAEWLRQRPVDLGILTVPSAVAQDMADRLVAGGVTRLWSFASQVLTVPPGVTVQREDLSAGLAELMVRSRLDDA